MFIALRTRITPSRGGGTNLIKTALVKTIDLERGGSAIRVCQAASCAVLGGDEIRLVIIRTTVNIRAITNFAFTKKVQPFHLAVPLCVAVAAIDAAPSGHSAHTAKPDADAIER